MKLEILGPRCPQGAFPNHVNKWKERPGHADHLRMGQARVENERNEGSSTKGGGGGGVSDSQVKHGQKTEKKAVSRPHPTIP